MSNIYRFPGTEEMPNEIDTEEEEREIPRAARIGLRILIDGPPLAPELPPCCTPRNLM